MKLLYDSKVDVHIYRYKHVSIKYGSGKLFCCMDILRHCLSKSTQYKLDSSIYRARHIRYLSQHQSVNGIWLIIFLMYVYTARTSFDLLRCVPTYDSDDNFMASYCISNCVICTSVSF